MPAGFRRSSIRSGTSSSPSSPPIQPSSAAARRYSRKGGTGRSCNIPIPAPLRAPHGWIFVIPLTVHTSYGYIFNRDVSSIADVESDFDAFLETDGVAEFEQRAVIPFPNFVHRRMYDGAIARIGNAAAFMEPLEATAIVAAQLQIGMVLHMRLNRAIEHLERDAPVVNRFLVNNMLCYGLFVGWHYSCGSKHDSEFWRYARDDAWPRHRTAADPEAVGCAALRKFDDMLALMNQPVIDKADRDRMCAVPLTSYCQLSQGLGC